MTIINFKLSNHKKKHKIIRHGTLVLLHSAGVGRQFHPVLTVTLHAREIQGVFLSLRIYLFMDSIITLFSYLDGFPNEYNMSDNY